MKQLTQDVIKKNVGTKAATLVEDGMLVGLGTGSTVRYFIDGLIDRCKKGLKITAVATSMRSEEQAKKGGIPFRNADEIEHLDLTVDGADEIDPQNRMIKGGGGALVREKILATSSSKIVIIVDESKLVSTLGHFGVPVEIIPFCYPCTLAKIRRAGYEGKLRLRADGAPYITDNGNYIFDIHTPNAYTDPEKVHQHLDTLPGVVETGFFFNLPIHVLIGYKDGSVVFRDKTHSKEVEWTKQ